MKTVNIKPLKPSKAVNHPAYPDRLRQAAAHFLSKVPDGLCGRQILSLLSYGSAEDIKKAGILLWDNVPDARDAATRIDALARHMLAVEGYEVSKARLAAADSPAPAADPLEAAVKKAGIPMPPPDVLDVIRKAVGIKPGDKVTITHLGGADAPGEAPSHGLPEALHAVVQRLFPGSVVVDGKVVSAPNCSADLLQLVIDRTLEKGRAIGLTP